MINCCYFTVILTKSHRSFDMWRILMNDPILEINICQLQWIFKYHLNFNLLKHFFRWDSNRRSSHDGIKDRVQWLIVIACKPQADSLRGIVYFWQVLMFSFGHKSCMSPKEVSLWFWDPRIRRPVEQSSQPVATAMQVSNVCCSKPLRFGGCSLLQRWFWLKDWIPYIMTRGFNLTFINISLKFH